MSYSPIFLIVSCNSFLCFSRSAKCALSILFVFNCCLMINSAARQKRRNSVPNAAAILEFNTTVMLQINKMIAIFPITINAFFINTISYSFIAPSYLYYFCYFLYNIELRNIFKYFLHLYLLLFGALFLVLRILLIDTRTLLLGLWL